VPIAFSVPYDPNRIDPGKPYFVEASITDGGQPIFRSTDPYPVLTMGAPSTVEVLVRSGN
jgi:putative lipoprotein